MTALTGPGTRCEQVREHLEQLGYHDVPGEVLEDFRRELTERIVSGVQSGAAADEHMEDDYDAGVALKPARGAGVDDWEGGAKKGGVGSTPVRERKSQLGNARRVDPRVVINYDADDSEYDKENAEVNHPADAARRPKSAPARRPITALGYASPPARQERPAAPSPTRVGSSASLASRASHASPAVIRPAPHPHGRGAKKSDPVAAYHRARQSWAAAPSVVSTRKQVVAPVASVRPPQETRIWKATHPLHNSAGWSDYQGPGRKLSAAERAAVRDSLKWTDVYRPPRADRVAANLAARAYTIPDEKRRDAVRWDTRVMMMMD